MSFDSPLFIFFFSFVLLIHYSLPRVAARRILLLVASFFFIAVAGIFSSLTCIAFTAFTFGAAWLIARSRGTGGAWLAASVSAVAAAWMALRLHQQASGFFPLGFSFYSFAAVTFLVDCYERKTKPALFDYGSALLFFPTLISGPIVRTTDLIARQRAPDQVGWPEARRHSVRIAAGFFKKSVSELISASMWLRLAHAESLPGRYTWLYVVAFMAKYYADFSGYSDIAIGAAGLLGIRLPNNFNLPFLADSITDFWRRWHMSLNAWVNHYVFRPLVYSDALSPLRRIPLAGARLFENREYPAILLAMALIGIWHGLTLNYLGWGLYMGALVCFEARWGGRSRLPRVARVPLTFFLLVNGFVLVIAPSLGGACGMWQRMYDARAFVPTSEAVVYLMAVSAVLVLPHFVDAALIRLDHLARRPALALVACVLLFGLHFFMDGFYGAAFEYSRF